MVLSYSREVIIITISILDALVADGEVILLCSTSSLSAGQGTQWLEKFYKESMNGGGANGKRPCWKYSQ